MKPETYEEGSPEYSADKTRLSCASRRRNRRNRYTKAVRSGNANPFDHVPKKPSQEDMKFLRLDADLKAYLKSRSDRQWFIAIDRATKDPFMRSKLAALIWWVMKSKSTKPYDRAAWKKRRRSHYDFDLDLFTDWKQVEYCLHLCGFAPSNASSMTGENHERKACRDQMNIVYRCEMCSKEHTNLSFKPERCPSCGTPNTLRKTKG